MRRSKARFRFSETVVREVRAPTAEQSKAVLWETRFFVLLETNQIAAPQKTL